MISVLISNAYWYPLDPKQWDFKQPYPPLGTLWAASVLRRDGFDVSFSDTNLSNDPNRIKEKLETIKPKYLVIYDDGFNYLTKMCLGVMRDGAFSLATAGKAAGCTVIISSSDASDHYEKYFEHGVDYVVRGEGEESLSALLNSLEADNTPEKLQGIAYQQHGQAVVTPPRAVIRNLDALPQPAWDLVDIEAYRRIWMSHHGYFSLNLATTRGCPYKCNWCAKPIYGNRYNTRSPEQVVNEIEFLLEHYKPDHFWMCDDIFGLKPGWVLSFAELVVQKQLKFRYKIQSRVDLLTEPQTLKLMAASGIDVIWVGAESGSQKILDAMDKGTKVEEIMEATRLMKENKIRPAFFLQFGYPGETWQDIQSTINMVLELMPDEIGISVSYPLPGTKFFENVKADLKSKQNWSDSDDLAMMFHGTYVPAFYKVLYRYVHNRYRIQRGVNEVKSWLKKPFFPAWHEMRKIVSMVYNLPLSFINAIQLKKLSRIEAAV